MPKPRFPYLQKQTTRHGRLNWYVRVNRGPKIRIRGEYGSDDFMKQYHAAIAGEPFDHKQNEDIRSLSWLINRYKQSAQWVLLKPGTRKQRDGHLFKIKTTAGDVPFKAICKQNILDAIDKRRDTPAAANTFLKSVRGLFNWSEESNFIDVNPTTGILKLKYKTDGHSPWSEDDVNQYRECFQIGTRERLAMELLLWTGLRRSDVVRIGRQHLKNGVIHLPAQKNGVDVFLTIPDHLQIIIDQSPTGDLAFIATKTGRPRNSDSFGNWFSASARKAGLKKRSAHGLRKTAATLSAEAGATNKELQAAFGWVSDYESNRYTKKADRKRLGLMNATKRLKDQNSSNLLQPPFPVVAKSQKE